MKLNIVITKISKKKKTYWDVNCLKVGALLSFFLGFSNAR